MQTIDVESIWQFNGDELNDVQKTICDSNFINCNLFDPSMRTKLIELKGPTTHDVFEWRPFACIIDATIFHETII